MSKKLGFRIEIEPRSQWDDNMWKIKLLPMEYDEHRRHWTGYGSLSGFMDNAIAHLVIEAWGDNRSRKLSHSWEVNLKDIYSAHNGEIQAMAKLLAGIERALTKAREQDGEALSFGQFCLRVAKSLKATNFLFLKLNHKDYENDERFHIRTLSDGQSSIDHEIYKWQQEGQKEAA